MSFAVTGVAGFVAPRHLAAIKATGNRLLAALDLHDSVGVLDHYFLDTPFFTDIDAFTVHLGDVPVRYVSVCSPNFVHRDHCALGLRLGADVICEKPIVIAPRDLEELAELEASTGRRVFTVLQLRKHPTLAMLKRELGSGHHRVDLTYLTPRGPWYARSWKGDDARSGGIAFNIGIHLFDMLLWLFGPVVELKLSAREPTRMRGELHLERAHVTWLLSIDPRDTVDGVARRTIVVDGSPFDFATGFADLHTQVYADIIAGAGLGVSDARPSVELAHQIAMATLR